MFKLGSGRLALVLEGPPGAGKTTLFSTLVQAFGDRCVFFGEPNPAAVKPALPTQRGASARSMWYLRCERARLAAMAAYADEPVNELLVCDRNHLGALAYCYATDDPDALPYETARAYFTRHIAPAIPVGLRTIVLLVSVPTSLARRGGRPEHPRLRLWYDASFLERLRDFYLYHATELCPNPPLVIDTEALTHVEVLDSVKAELVAAGLTFPASEPAPIGRTTLDDEFRAAHQAAGGVRFLGHPVTPRFSYRGGAVQMFELGSLHAEGDGVGTWDPIAAFPRKEVKR